MSSELPQQVGDKKSDEEGTARVAHANATKHIDRTCRSRQGLPTLLKPLLYHA